MAAICLSHTASTELITQPTHHPKKDISLFCIVSGPHVSYPYLLWSLYYGYDYNYVIIIYLTVNYDFDWYSYVFK